MADLALPQTLTLPEDFASALGEPVAALDEVVQQALNSAAHRERWKYTKADRFLAQTSEPASPPQITGERQTGVSWQRQPIAQPMSGLDLQQAPEAFARLCFAGEAMRITAEELAGMNRLADDCAEVCPGRVVVRAAQIVAVNNSGFLIMGITCLAGR